MMKWIVCHSDCKYLHQKLLPSRIINFLSQRDREMTIPTTVFTKKSGCTIFVNLLVFKIVFATIIKFVCSSSAGIWSPEKCYRYTVIKFVAEVQFQILVLEFLKMLHYQYIPSSNLFVVAVAILHIWNELLDSPDLFKQI